MLAARGRGAELERGMLARRADHVDDVVDELVGEADRASTASRTAASVAGIGDRLAGRNRSSRGMAERWPWRRTISRSSSRLGIDR